MQARAQTASQQAQSPQPGTFIPCALPDEESGALLGPIQVSLPEACLSCLGSERLLGPSDPKERLLSSSQIRASHRFTTWFTDTNVLDSLSLSSPRLCSKSLAYSRHSAFAEGNSGFQELSLSFSLAGLLCARPAGHPASSLFKVRQRDKG